MLNVVPKRGEHLGPHQPVHRPERQQARPERRHHVEGHALEELVGDEGRRLHEQQRHDPEDGQQRRAAERRPLLRPPL